MPFRFHYILAISIGLKMVLLGGVAYFAMKGFLCWLGQ